MQYSKTDTKDVKKGRIIPEDVDKNISSQIEKRFDDEVERLYGSISDRPNVKRYAELMANKFANNQYVDTFDYDKKMQPTKKHDGLKTIIDSLDNKLKDIEKKYGIKQSDNIRDIERRVKEGQSLSEAIDDSRTNGGNDRLRNHAGGSDAGREGTSGSGERNAIRTLEGLRVLDEYKRATIDKAAAERAREYLIERFNDFRHKYGLEEGDWASQDLAERIFNDNNSNKEVQKIFDRIRGLVEILGTKLRHGAESRNRVKGYYNHPENFIHIDSDFLSAIRFTKQDLASTVCHEMLHVVTSDIINLYRKGYGDLLTESQRQAAKEVVDLYDEIKSYFDKHIGGTEPYALTNPAEMITELANPEWRKIAAQIPAQKGWFRRSFNAIKKMLGFHVDTTTDLDRLDKSLENVIRNFDYERFQKGAELNNEIVESKVTDPDEIKRLEEEPKIKVYRAMQVIDGKLYPPMAASVGGRLVEANELGVWIRADENPDLAIPDIDPKTGKQKVDKKTGELKWKFKLDKGGKDATGKKATDVNAAYNPYWHLSRSPLNDQFKSAWIRPNIVIVECEVPVSELTSGYKAERAKDAVGEVDWKSGSVSGEVFKQPGRARKLSSLAGASLLEYSVMLRWLRERRSLSVMQRLRFLRMY